VEECGLSSDLTVATNCAQGVGGFLHPHRFDFLRMTESFRLCLRIAIKAMIVTNPQSAADGVMIR
jgi:hypothetical protein